jgi:hypothetical protein
MRALSFLIGPESCQQSTMQHLDEMVARLGIIILAAFLCLAFVSQQLGFGEPHFAHPAVHENDFFLETTATGKPSRLMGKIVLEISLSRL